jgi:hypothetical protein
VLQTAEVFQLTSGGSHRSSTSKHKQVHRQPASQQLQLTEWQPGLARPVGARCQVVGQMAGVRQLGRASQGRSGRLCIAQIVIYLQRGRGDAQ